MCGFVAMIRLDGRTVERALIQRMADTIRHRGPDDSGEYFSGPVAFGFRRLSILDLSPLGHQPMTTPDGRYTIVFNGEIYNYRELRRELEAAGHRFHSSGDTEVLLHAYVQWGPECLSRLNGMWAFLIHDKVRKAVFGSRDRFGIKPLFMHSTGQHIILASEIKALRATGLVPRDVQWSVAADFLLRFKLDGSRHSFHQGIEKLPAGYAFEVSQQGAYREWPYWQVQPGSVQDVGDPAGRFAELFEDAVRMHMRSDVPVGVHLSGGLDSSSIVCAAARVRAADGATQPIRAFSYQAKEYDETRFIEDTVAQTGAQLTRLASDPGRFFSRLNELMWYQDEPFHSINLLVGFELMRLTAASGIKVVLNGQGADETLAGYPTYFRDYWSTLVRQGRFGQAWSEMAAHGRGHGGGSTAGQFARQCKHVLQGMLAGSSAYRALSARRRRQQVQADDWFTPQLQQAVPVSESETGPADLDASLKLSIEDQPLPLYLRLEDRNSMAHSIEARVPFLDHRLVELAFSLPANWRMRGPWNKYILREAMRGRIPESVRTRLEKFGFPVPVKQWISDALYGPARDLLTSRAARERGIYNVDNILRDLERHRRGEIDVGYKVFNVLQFETWSSINQRPVLAATAAEARDPAPA